jgi:hypothetical protein
LEKRTVGINFEYFFGPIAMPKSVSRRDVKHVCDKKNRFLLNSPNSESYLDGSVIKGKKQNKNTF